MACSHCLFAGINAENLPYIQKPTDVLKLTIMATNMNRFNCFSQVGQLQDVRVEIIVKGGCVGQRMWQDHYSFVFDHLLQHYIICIDSAVVIVAASVTAFTTPNIESSATDSKAPPQATKSSHPDLRQVSVLTCPG